MALSSVVRQVLIGLGVGAFCMVTVTILVVVLLVYRRKYIIQEKTIKRDFVPSLDYFPQLRDQPGTMDMSRTVAFNRRSFHSNDRRHPSNGFLDASHDPTLRPLHGYNDPFYYRESSNHSSSRDVTPRNTNSSRGGIAVVPFRESVLPSARTSFAPDGRILTPHGERRSSAGSGSDHGRGRLFQGARVGRVPRPSYTPVHNGNARTDSNSEHLRNTQRPNGLLRHDDTSYSDQASMTSSQEPVSFYRAEGARTPPSPTLTHIEFPRDSSHLNDVYY